jgi:glycosyltransferase involved in cell wall biosynthesis
MRIINIVDTLEKVNYGIWNAAIATAPYLQQHHHCQSVLWFPSITQLPSLEAVHLHGFSKLSSQSMEAELTRKQYSPTDTIIVTHGCWQFPTRWGQQLKQKGFKWVYVPHGMLEPWSMRQKWIKKQIYFHLIEKPMLRNADAIRAVGSPEALNIKQLCGISPILIPNGITVQNTTKASKDTQTRNYLFMARLHHKKGVMPMVEAWKNSSLANHPDFKLTIAGPDDGELTALLAFIQQSNISNIHYVGAVYGAQKDELLKNSHFYLLPSYSEGFPTSLLEAMQQGLIPLMTKGCNFPEAIENELAIEITPERNSIQWGLEQSRKMTHEKFMATSNIAINFVNNHYALENIAQQQADLYQKLLKS